MDLVGRNVQQRWFLLFLVAVPGSVLSQVQLQESGPSLVTPSQTLSLACSVSGFSLTTYHVHWVRQAPGKGLDWVGGIWSDGSTSYKFSLQSRVSISRDTSKNQVYLKLSNSVTEDTAVYYCVREPTGTPGYWGQGTMVTVSSVSQQHPTVFPLHAVSADTSEAMILGCLVRDFFPLPASVSWNPSSNSMRDFPAVLGTGGLYTMSSQLQLTRSQCPDKAECRVLHNGTTKLMNVSCTEPTKPPPTCVCEPRVTLHPPALEDLLLGFEANLTCTLSGLRDPEGATFSWKPLGEKEPIQGTPKKDICGCYKVSSYLPGCADPWNRGETFTCSATHKEAPEPLTTSIAKAQGNTFRPQVHLLPPPSEELGLNELVTLTCLVRGFSPADVLVKWLHGNQQLPRKDYVTWSAQPEPGQGGTTYTVTSLLRVDAEVWNKGDTFTCVVGHEALPLNFTQKSIDRLAGKPTHVNVSVIMAEAEGVCY